MSNRLNSRPRNTIGYFSKKPFFSRLAEPRRVTIDLLLDIVLCLIMLFANYLLLQHLSSSVANEAGRKISKGCDLPFSEQKQSFEAFANHGEKPTLGQISLHAKHDPQHQAKQRKGPNDY